MELAENDAAIARSLRLALAGTDGADRLAAEVEKRLRTLHRANGYIEWDKVRSLARELDGLWACTRACSNAVTMVAASWPRSFVKQAGTSGGCGTWCQAAIPSSWRGTCWPCSTAMATA